MYFVENIYHKPKSQVKSQYSLNTHKNNVDNDYSDQIQDKTKKRFNILIK